jgi:two-component system cell cycle sensor histidine kinase/response regulator CckA
LPPVPFPFRVAQPVTMGSILDFPKEALEAFPYGLVLVNRDRSLVSINAAAAALFERRGVLPGVSLDTLQSALALFDATKQTQIANDRWPAARALAGENAEPAEFAARAPNLKTLFWLECGAKPVRGSDGTVEGVAFTLQDITDRRKREIALTSATRLRDFIYYGNVSGVIHTTVDGRIVDTNDAMVRMLGYPSKEALQAVRAPQYYYDPADRDRLLRLIAAKHSLNDYEICFRRKDNSRCWVLVNVRLLEPAAGEVGGSIIATVMDITERKLWEETLHQSEQRFATFMRHLPGIAFIKDLDGRYVYYNDACVALFGKSPAEIVGRTDAELWPADNAALYRSNDASVIETRRPVEVTEPVKHRDGPHSWLIYKFPILEDGEVYFVGGIGIDITERQTLEEQLTQSRKMEALGRLAGGVAHDFNNVLTVISGYGQLALEGIDSTPHERLTMYLQEILSSARRAAGLTGQLLAFSRRQVIQPKVLDLAGLLSNLERLLRRMIGEHVELTLHCGDEPCLVRADANQLEQVMLNLAANARDAMPLGGTLDIGCHVLAEPRERPGLAALGVVVEVRDNGIGMDETVRGQLFEPFFSSKDKAKGTGLGLSTAYGVVTQADGEIEVESEPGEGTVFRIYFPLATGEVEVLPAPHEDVPAQMHLEMVLLVEDEESVRTLTEMILRRQGYRVLTADCGAAALEIWNTRKDEIDILLTDVIMPQMSGSQLAHRLREMRPDLKVLFMSGYTDDMIAGHGVLAGETQLIQKPFSSRDLGIKLRAVLDA